MKIGSTNGHIKMHGMLQLMKVSIMFHRKSDHSKDYEFILAHISNARKIFDKYKMEEAIAEAFYLEALVLSSMKPNQVDYVKHGSRHLQHAKSE